MDPPARDTLPARLKAAGIRPNRLLGQNFLCDGNMLEAIVRMGEISPGDAVLEIGCGPGNLTSRIAPHARRVLAVERDPALATFARAALAGAPNVEILEGDALDGTGESLSPALRERLAREPSWVCLSNLPYGAGARILLSLLDAGIPFSRLVVMLQDDVGERLTAAPGERENGALTLRAAWYASVERGRRVPASVFWPPPAVRSVLLRVTPRTARPSSRLTFAQFSRGLDAIFRHPRKQLARTIVMQADGWDLARAESFLRSAGAEPRARPQDLDPAGAARLVEAALSEPALAESFRDAPIA